VAHLDSRRCRLNFSVTSEPRGHSNSCENRFLSRHVFLLLSPILFVVFGSQVAIAAGTAATIDTSDTAWVLASTELVLFMTIPGLAIFYAGLVRKKQRSVGLDAISLIWIIAGASRVVDRA